MLRCARWRSATGDMIQTCLGLAAASADTLDAHIVGLPSFADFSDQLTRLSLTSAPGWGRWGEITMKW